MRVGLVGATGYAGLELLRLLAMHPARPQVALVTSRQEAGRPLTGVFPALAGVANYDGLTLEAPEAAALAGRADFFFLATPHGLAMELAPALLAGGAKVIDLSADFRLKDPQTFARWYQPHAAPGLLAEAVYGLPELYAPAIGRARLVANPGCYPTSAILALAPLMKAGLWAAGTPVIVDAASGVTGAGRGASLANSFCEVQGSFKAYKATGHRHTPEMEQELSLLSGAPVRVSFTPHLAPMGRGILATVYAVAARDAEPAELHGLYAGFYRGQPFVRVRPLGFEPQTADVRGTDFCDLSVFWDGRARLVKVISAIDNLCRGAAGQAVANFNLMAGGQAGDGLALAPLKP